MLYPFRRMVIVSRPYACAYESFPMGTQILETLWYEIKADLSGNMCYSMAPVSAITKLSGRAFGGISCFVEVSRRY